MTAILTRAAKGAPLTHDELDQNQTHLNRDKAEATDLAALDSTVQQQGGELGALRIAVQQQGADLDTVGLTVQAHGEAFDALAPVARSNRYDDLDDLPTLPTAPQNVVVNVAPAAAVVLDLSALPSGGADLLFVVPIAATTRCALSFANPPATGTLGRFIVHIINGVGVGADWPSSVRWPGGDVPPLTGVAGKVDTLVFYTFDGGATYFGQQVGANQ